MNAPKEDPLDMAGTGEPGTIVILQSWTAYRDECAATAAKLTKPSNADELAYTVKVWQWCKEIIDRTTDVEEARRKPVNRWLKDIRKMRDDFLESVTTQHKRIGTMVDDYRRAELMAEQAEERKRQEGIRKAQEEAAALQSKIDQQWQELESLKGKEKQEAEDKLVETELAAETAQLNIQIAAEIIPAKETPKGLSTRVRLDFQVTDPSAFYRAFPQFWQWKLETETIKLLRQNLLDALNSADVDRFNFGESEGLPAPVGVRVFQSVKTHVRA